MNKKLWLTRDSRKEAGVYCLWYDIDKPHFAHGEWCGNNSGPFVVFQGDCITTGDSGANAMIKANILPKVGYGKCVEIKGDTK